MDVLELPRPVINFLRTMAKEGCRYVLSWDIFGGTDAVTLTLTWKLNDEHSKSSQPAIYMDLPVHHEDVPVSPRRSRRDENLSSKSTVVRPIRGKSLDDHITPPVVPSKSNISQLTSIERSIISRRQKKESDPIYANISHIKSSPNRSPSSSCYYNSSNRQVKLQGEHATHRRTTTPSTSIINETSSKIKRIDHQPTPNHDTLDPWVKRFECSLEDNPTESIDIDDDETFRTNSTPGKVKFKRVPDYF